MLAQTALQNLLLPKVTAHWLNPGHPVVVLRITQRLSPEQYVLVRWIAMLWAKAINLELFYKTHLRSVRWSFVGLPFLVVVFYLMAAFEMDPGQLGDDFGDVYDTYLPAQLTNTPPYSLEEADIIMPAPHLVVTGWPYVLAVGRELSLMAETWPPPLRRRPLYLVWRVFRL